MEPKYLLQKKKGSWSIVGHLYVRILKNTYDKNTLTHNPKILWDNKFQFIGLGTLLLEQQTGIGGPVPVMPLISLVSYGHLQNLSLLLLPISRTFYAQTHGQGI